MHSANEYHLLWKLLHPKESPIELLTFQSVKRDEGHSPGVKLLGRPLPREVRIFGATVSLECTACSSLRSPWNCGLIPLGLLDCSADSAMTISVSLEFCPLLSCTHVFSFGSNFRPYTLRNRSSAFITWLQSKFMQRIGINHIISLKKQFVWVIQSMIIDSWGYHCVFKFLIALFPSSKYQSRSSRMKFWKCFSVLTSIKLTEHKRSGTQDFRALGTSGGTQQ